MIIKISRSQVNALLEEARRSYPIEICGALFGLISEDEAHVEEIIPLKNVLRSEVMFQINPEEFLKVLLEHERRGLRHIGFFHSHLGCVSPSSIDLKYMSLWPESIWIIVSCHPKPKIAAYRVINDRFEEVNVNVE